MGKPVYLTVGTSQRVLGQVFEAGDVPELLRYVADFYDDNPDDCARLFGAAGEDGPGQQYLLNPFGGDYAGL